jgi:uncharacterized damage-inducible protein DinB
MDRSIIEKYEAGIDKLRNAVAGLSVSELQAKPIAGKWSTQQVVIHLADAEAAFVDRVKRIIAQDEPALLAWDENRFTERLHYEAQSTADAVELIALSRRQLARILQASPDNVLDRSGIHSEAGRMTTREVLAKAVSHLDHHLKFIDEKRKALGK